MKKLKAFVAHSFDERDQPVIKPFLDYFDSLKKTTNFEWDHAEGAEIKAVSQKVKEKMEGKNLFIGIFTTKDFRIYPDKLAAFIPKWFLGLKSNFSKGSSEWIVQESGYALAKDMKLLFLIEKGVRPTEGLQGDLEYVIFERENSSSCFKKINPLSYLS